MTDIEVRAYRTFGNNPLYKFEGPDGMRFGGNISDMFFDTLVERIGMLREKTSVRLSFDPPCAFEITSRMIHVYVSIDPEDQQMVLERLNAQTK